MERQKAMKRTPQKNRVSIPVRKIWHHHFFLWFYDSVNAFSVKTKTKKFLRRIPHFFTTKMKMRKNILKTGQMSTTTITSFRLNNSTIFSETIIFAELAWPAQEVELWFAKKRRERTYCASACMYTNTVYFVEENFSMRTKSRWYASQPNYTST